MLKNYPGAKTNSGIIPFLVNEIPAHRRYFELCAGSGQLYQAKAPAVGGSYLNDINPMVIEALRLELVDRGVILSSHSATDFLKIMAAFFTREDFIYLDPPYPKKSRRSGAKIYKHEMLSDDDHTPLLSTIVATPANIMISTSPNELYDLHLKDWRKKEFETVGHRGKQRTEVIFMNYPQPTILHQYDMLGRDYIERQHLSRVRSRFAEKLSRVDTYTLHIMMEELVKKDPAAVQHFLTVLSGK